MAEHTDSEIAQHKKSEKRQLTGLLAWIVKILAIGTPAFVVAYQLHLFQRLHIMIYPVGYRALITGMLLALVFLLIPMRKGKAGGKLPWYDALFAILILVACGYVFLFYRAILTHAGISTFTEQILGVMVILLVLEAVRRTVGWIVVIMFALFLLYPSFCNYLPGLLHGTGYDIQRVIGHMYLYEDGVFGVIMKVITGIVIPFILFGQFLDAAGAGRFFVDFSHALMGRFRGGPAKIAVLASALLGTITGSASANVATTGVITIPLMKKIGYKPAFAGAVETVASNGGSLTPPVMGATAFIMAEFTGTPYNEIALAAAIPAFLYYLALYLQVDMQAINLGLKGLPREQLPSVKRTFIVGWPFFFPLAVLVYLLIFLKYDPVMAALYSIVALFLASMFRKETRLTPAKIARAFEETSKGLVSQIGIMAGAGFIVGAVGLTGLGIRLSQMLIQLSGGSLLILLILAAIANYFLGMGLPGAACYVLLAVLVAPALEQMGVPMIAAHMFVFWTAMWSHITPPVAPAAFVAASISGADPFKTGFAAMRLAIVGYLVPFAFVYAPALLFMGDGMIIAMDMVKTSIAVFFLACGIEGRFFGKINLVQRILFIFAGLGLFDYRWQSDIIGIAAGILVMGWQFLGPRINKKEPANAR